MFTGLNSSAVRRSRDQSKMVYETGGYHDWSQMADTYCYSISDLASGIPTTVSTTETRRRAFPGPDRYREIFTQHQTGPAFQRFDGTGAAPSARFIVVIFNNLAQQLQLLDKLNVLPLILPV